MLCISEGFTNNLFNPLQCALYLLITCWWLVPLKSFSLLIQTDPLLPWFAVAAILFYFCALEEVQLVVQRNVIVLKIVEASLTDSGMVQSLEQGHSNRVGLWNHTTLLLYNSESSGQTVNCKLWEDKRKWICHEEKRWRCLWLLDWRDSFMEEYDDCTAGTGGFRQTDRKRLDNEESEGSCSNEGFLTMMCFTGQMYSVSLKWFHKYCKSSFIRCWCLMCLCIV